MYQIKPVLVHTCIVLINDGEVCPSKVLDEICKCATEYLMIWVHVDGEIFTWNACVIDGINVRYKECLTE